MKRLSQYFFHGLLVFVPLTVTVYVVYTVFVKIDSLFHFKIPGIGFALTILIILGIGVAASNILTKNIVSLIDLFFARLPLVKMIYSALKDLINAFVGEKKSFDKPVLVSLFPNSDTQMIGFMTRTSLENFGIADRVAVYFPQSFNFGGNLLIIPRDRVLPIDTDPSDVMGLVVSGGISSRTH
ncbi:MAG: DUF502 domain-containing protein [Deltaproteobacteria bacterium]|jgi:uncharacterized membrane protein|nr:DUF502 domain-containing protein [Deltaproteobacteria bacterium]